MMATEFGELLDRYGQEVTLYSGEAPEGRTLRAFFQPVRDKGTAQAAPSALGEVRQDRFLYLGPPEGALDCDGTCSVEVRGEVYRPQTVQPVYVGRTLSHWWAVLSRRAREVV